jgi:hypothetical protein
MLWPTVNTCVSDRGRVDGSQTPSYCVCMRSRDDLSELERTIAAFDELLTPIAKRSFDFNDHDWVAQLLLTPHPLDEIDLRAEMEKLLADVTDLYARCGVETRVAIRALFETYGSVSWAAAPPWPPTTEDGFRRHLLLFSVLDQGRDTRDAILWLRDIASRARVAGIDVDAPLEEVAAISSEENRYGMGSTRRLLLNARS